MPRLLLAALLLLASGAALAQDISLVAPTFGGAGTRITINGRDFAAPLRVFIGHKEARVLSVSSTSIVAEVPELPPALWPVRVVLVGGPEIVAPPGYWFMLGATAPNFRYERVLLPIFIHGVQPGARGSRWVTEATGRNDAPFNVNVTQSPMLSAPRYGAPRSTFRPAPIPLINGGGAFLYVEQNSSLKHSPVGFTLRIRDTSREAQGWGTLIPVVHERDAFIERPMSLLDIPVGVQSRQMLRIYDFDGQRGASAYVQIYADRTNDLLADFVVTLSSAPGTTNPSLPAVPGYAQVDLAAFLPTDFPTGRVRVKVQPNEDARLWAFVSITNNETQQVTTVTPQ